MPIIKLYSTETKFCSKQVLANNLESLFTKATEKLGFDVKKILLRDDKSEIDDEEVFQELLKLNASSLEVIALRETDVIENDENADDGLVSGDDEELDDLLDMKSKLADNKKTSLMSKVDQEKLAQKQLEKKINKLEMSQTLEAERQKKENLLNRYRELQNAKTATKTILTKEIEHLEERCEKLDLHNKRVDKIFQELQKAERVDICFLVDCTGSMAPYINEAKTVIHKVMNKLSKKFQFFQLRFAFVGYRDHTDGADRVSVRPFTMEEDDFRMFINTLTAIGGADECEDIFGGLEEVLKLDWQHMTRILFHVGDAPCHGRRYYISANDSYPDGDPRGLRVEDLMLGIAELGIHYYFAKVNETTDKMVDEFNMILAKSNGNQIMTMKLASAADFTETVSKSITASIMSSKSASVTTSSGKTLKTRVVERTLDWRAENFKKHTAFLHKGKYELPIDQIRTQNVSYEKKPVELYLAEKPFASGCLRFAYAAYMREDPKSPNFSKCVVKESKFAEAQYNTLKYLKESIEGHILSVSLAREFQRVSLSRKAVSFVEINIIELEETGQYYSIEYYLEGEFKKWSNNAGFINEEDYSATLDCFAHWTFQVTKEYLAVVDLQGVCTPNAFYLTDPAITCPDDFDRFSSTNLGRKGLKKFFEAHKCNHFCERLKLKKHAFQKEHSMKTIVPSSTQFK